jgi:hypothetical protein
MGTLDGEVTVQRIEAFQMTFDKCDHVCVSLLAVIVRLYGRR